MDFITRTSTEDDVDIMRSLLKNNYYSDEVIFQCFLRSKQSMVTKEEMEKINEDINNYTEASILYGPNKLFIDKKTGNTIGILSYLVSENPNFQQTQKTSNYYRDFKPKSKISEDYLNYIIDMADEAQVYKYYPDAKNAMELCIGVIDRKHRKNGYGTIAMEKAIELAIENRIDVIYALFTSPYSIRLAENFEFKILKEFDLSKYQDSRGVSINPKFSSGITVSVMAKRLDYSSSIS